jgi:geranylgeranyl diphosphate synthase type II
MIKMADEGLAKKALEILQVKSEKALKNVKELILQEKFECERVNEALRYYISTWNDTTRPGVLALAHEAVGGELEEVVPLQTAMLLIDAAMDIHDDILDKSTIKHSKKTLYGKFGEELALLIGNSLLIKGLNYLNKAAENLSINRKQVIIDNVKDFLLKVIDAHILEAELKKTKWNVKPDEYFHMLEIKAADIEGHMRIGAIYAGGTEQQVEAMTRLGKCLGTLLLVREDFVDVYEPDELMSRVKYECLPLPITITLQNKVYKEKIVSILSKEKIDERDTRNIVEIIYKTPEITRLKRQLNALKKRAIVEITNVSKAKAANELKLIISSTLEDL